MANVYEYVTTAPQSAEYANLGKAVGFAGLKSALEGDGLTLLAPKNDVFSKANIPMVYRWNAALTSELLVNHVAGNTEALSPESSKTLRMLSEEELDIARKGGKVTVDGKAVVLKKDEAGKYLVYSLEEGVLIPTTQTGTRALDTTLLTGAAGRLGAFFAGYATGDFYTALSSLNDAASEELFSPDLGYTVFLPEAVAWTALTNEVEKKVGTMEYLEDGGLETALKAHIVPGTAAVTDKSYTSLAGSPVDVKIPDVTIAGVESKIKNTAAANFMNGQVHNIDSVLQFPRKTTVEIAVATDATSSLVKLVTDFKLVDVLNSLKRSTIFAPTNAALNPLLTYAAWNTLEVTGDVITKILKHHVLDSRVYAKDLPKSGKVADAVDEEVIDLADLDVAAADVLGTNGNIHIINKPLIPPTVVSAIPTMETVVDIAKDTQTTSVLYSFLAKFPDVVKTLQTVAPGTSFTVFAPTDEAFAALTEEDLAYLTANDNKKLLEVLQYHVVPAAALASTLKPMNEFPTVLSPEKKLKVVVESNVVMVGNGAATVIGKDVKAINGVVHVIDEVLLPETVVLPSSVVDPDAISSASSLTVSAIVMAVASICIAAF